MVRFPLAELPQARLDNRRPANPKGGCFSLSIQPLSSRKGWTGRQVPQDNRHKGQAPEFLFHAVRKGRKPGVYLRWKQAKRQVDRFGGGMLRSFNSLDEAQRWAGATLDYKLALPKRMQSSDPLLTIDLGNGPPNPINLDWMAKVEDATDPSTNWDGAKEPLHGWPRLLPPTNQPHVPPTVVREPTASDATNEPELSPQQARVLDAVMRGSSCFFTGSAGTGKSVLLRAIIQSLWKREQDTREAQIDAMVLNGMDREEAESLVPVLADSIAVTASTGIAALNIAGRTLHSWAGVGLGEADEEILLKNVKRSPAHGRWIQARTLIIDEVSMVNGHLLDKLDYIGQNIRGCEEPFGGLQVILCGDFFQLPPVDKRKEGIPEKDHVPAIFAFESNCWKDLIRDEHRYNLTRVYRQRDESFIDILEAMRKGICDEKHQESLVRCDRILTYADGVDPVQLFPTRFEVQKENAARMSALKTPHVKYVCADGAGLDNARKPFGPMTRVSALLDDHSRFERVVELKVGATVMLVKNVGQGSPLVNGSMGLVVDFMTFTQASAAGIQAIGETAYHRDSPDVWPVVSFIPARLCAQQQYASHLVCPDSTTYENKFAEPMAARIQVPLILAWAMTIHKSQGQTLERLKVDLRRSFACGQVYVAISRATSLEGMEIRHFSPGGVLVSDKVLKWSADFEKQQAEEAELDAMVMSMDVDDLP